MIFGMGESKMKTDLALLHLSHSDLKKNHASFPHAQLSLRNPTVPIAPTAAPRQDCLD